MGEAKQKLRAHAAILADAPGCIYCAGENVATTIEHMPPIPIFCHQARPFQTATLTAKPLTGGFRAMMRGFVEILAQTIQRPLSKNELDAALA